MLNSVASAIGKGWHSTSNPKIKAQTWEAFEQAVKNRKLLLFGLGDGAKYFYLKYKDRFFVEGVIDNDYKKQGFFADEFITDGRDGFLKNVKVSPLSDLHQYDVKETVVLITSLKYYEEIAEQIEREGSYEYFALLPMEAKVPLSNGSDQDKKSAIQSNLYHYQELPIADSKLVFYTMGGYSGHGKAIAEQLLKKRKDLEIVWMVKDLGTEIPKEIRSVCISNKSRYLYEMSTAKIWVYDDQIPYFIEKRPGQIYVQVKHWSSVTLKTFGLNVPRFRKDEASVANWMHDSKLMDYVITGSDFDTETCRKGFDFQGKIMQLGSPRTDILFRRKEFRDKVYKEYGILQEQKTVLYAPTFRAKGHLFHTTSIGNMDLDFENLKYILEKRFGGSWKVLLRLHPRVASESDSIKKKEDVIDVSGYGDSEELVAASDVLITDYSSIMFEPAFVKKPVFLFTTDRNEYINIDRELLIDYDTLPFSIAESNEELTKNIRKFQKQEYEQDIERFLEKYGVREDGHASERAATFISGLIDKK